MLDVHLAPGRYKLLCNMSGHYLGGMHTALVVRYDGRRRRPEFRPFAARGRGDDRGASS